LLLLRPIPGLPVERLISVPAVVNGESKVNGEAAFLRLPSVSPFILSGNLEGDWLFSIGPDYPSILLRRCPGRRHFQYAHYFFFHSVSMTGERFEHRQFPFLIDGKLNYDSITAGWRL
jgi:hypothetical protein